MELSNAIVPTRDITPDGRIASFTCADGFGCSCAEVADEESLSSSNSERSAHADCGAAIAICMEFHSPHLAGREQVPG